MFWKSVAKFLSPAAVDLFNHFFQCNGVLIAVLLLQTGISQVSTVLQIFAIFTLIDHSLIMQTLTVEITNNNALKVLQDLQEKHFIKILTKPDRNSFAGPGEPLTAEEFKNMIEEAENSGSISLKEAKTAWAKQRAEIVKLGK